MRKFTFPLALMFAYSLLAQDDTNSFERKNLGEKVNSKYNEMTPRISADGKTLFFVREDHPGNKNMQDIWYAELGDDGHWKEAVRADKKVNKLTGNCVWSVNADGNTVLIRGAFDKGNFVGRGFSLTRLTQDGWTDAQALKIDDLDVIDHGPNDGAYLSVDGNAIVFTMCEKVNCHEYDLYVSTKKEDGSFTRPQKIGGKVNTTSNEFAPFLASDNKTMYFSSDRPGGLGSTDIYKTERVDTGWTNWSEPVNMGAPINTPHKDAYYVTDAKSEYAYMVSDLNSFGGADIVRIKLSEQHKSKPVVLMDGKFYDAQTKKLLHNVTLEYNVYPDDADEGVAHPDHQTGIYKAVLPYGYDYAINVYAKGYLPYYDTVSLKTEGAYKEIKRDYYLVPIEIGQKVVLKHIFFETGKYDLLPESYYELDKVVNIMKGNKYIEIEVGGHTDDVGDEAANQLLSLNRAAAVQSYLVAKGIELHRVTAVGYGEKNPLVAIDTDENKKQNRRVEFIIKKK
jgi:OmpA-OmpF porin, OOP family